MERQKNKADMLNKKKVLLGLSGGVDSTAAALLLKEKGFNVTGYYFDVTGGKKAGFCDARKVADQLGIELICDDVSADFREKVIGNFCSEYLCGRTPNPCVVCNTNIKFKKLIERADSIGSYYIATGHYCRIYRDDETGACYVSRAANEKKDQSYMLYRLGQDVLSRLIFPLGEFSSKDETRELARSKNLQNAEKKDSQEICFVEPSENYVEYIKNLGFDSEPGHFIDKNGRVLGEHKGIVNYTVGQRKGLGIALGKPAFVTAIDYDKNTITLGDNDDLFTNTVISCDNVFAYGEANDYDGMKVIAKVRYSAQLSEAVIKVDGNKITTTFLIPQRAATPGQSIVFYIKDHVIGGGFIE